MDFRRIIHILISSFLAVGAVIPGVGHAQVEIDIIPQDPSYTFGDYINFKASLQFTGVIDEVLLFVQINGDTDIQVHPVSVDSQGNLSLELNVKESPLRAFSDVEYWYQVNFEDGETYTSPRYSFFYGDNRFQWKSLEGPPFRIHWYAGEVSHGEEVLNVALEGLRSSQNYLDVYFPETVDIYVYDTPQAIQDALPDAEQNWIAGHADPDQGVILVSLPPGAERHLEMERQIPHELMHIALNYTDAHAYSNLPAWFNEGLASLAELYPNPEYQALIESAYDSGSLFPLASLCQTFPNGSQDALLAYAQSASFTQFLYDQYGNPGFNRLLAAFASGMSCERGIEEALGTDLGSLEGSWRRENFADQAWMKTYEEFLPWIILLLVVLLGPLILVLAVIRNRSARMDL
jgi:hypothetical protein